MDEPDEPDSGCFPCACQCSCLNTVEFFGDRCSMCSEACGPETTSADLVNWDRIQRLAGRNPRWPFRWVYCFGSLPGVEDEWLKQFHAEAEERGFEIASGASAGDSCLYVLGPIGS